MDGISLEVPTGNATPLSLSPSSAAPQAEYSALVCSSVGRISVGGIQALFQICNKFASLFHRDPANDNNDVNDHAQDMPCLLHPTTNDAIRGVGVTLYIKLPAVVLQQSSVFESDVAAIVEGSAPQRWPM